MALCPTPLSLSPPVPSIALNGARLLDRGQGGTWSHGGEQKVHLLEGGCEVIDDKLPHLVRVGLQLSAVEGTHSRHCPEGRREEREGERESWRAFWAFL
jgi:hypothetical protein